MRRVQQAILIFLFIAPLINAQDSLNTKPHWLNFSAGGSPKTFGFGISYNKLLEVVSYQASINANADGIFSSKEMITGHIALGLTDKKDWLLSSVYLGPSVSYGESKNESYERVSFWGTGLALNAQVYFMPFNKLFPGVGIGAEFFYNYNAMLTESVNYRHLYSFRVGFTLTNLHDRQIR